MVKNYLVILIFLTSLNKIHAQTLAGFTSDRVNICNGTNIVLTNTSTGANAYEWFIEGVHFSYSQDTVATLYERCYDYQEIKLIARDTITGSIDSNSIIVEVFDTCFFHWTGDIIKCPGDTVNMGVFAEEIATEFTINAPYTLLSGCLTCPSISFILTQAGTLVDRKGTYSGGCFEITSYHYLCSAGIDEENFNDFHLFPNPVNDKIFIESTTGFENIMIYNELGEIVLSLKQNIYVSTLDLSQLSNGFYILKIQTRNGENIIRKIIKS